MRYCYKYLYSYHSFCEQEFSILFSQLSYAFLMWSAICVARKVAAYV